VHRCLWARFPARVSGVAASGGVGGYEMINVPGMCNGPQELSDSRNISADRNKI
jgi:hypothetical protein